MSLPDTYRVWVVAILALIASVAGWGIAWGDTQARSNELERRVSNLERAVEDLAAIRQDVQWIRRELDRAHR